MASTYTHTALGLGANGVLVSRSVVELDAELRVLRSNGLWSPHNGTDRYEEIWLSSRPSFVERIAFVPGTGAYWKPSLALELEPVRVIARTEEAV